MAKSEDGATRIETLNQDLNVVRDEPSTSVQDGRGVREINCVHDLDAIQPLLDANRQQNANAPVEGDVPKAILLLDAVTTTVIFGIMDIVVLITNLFLISRYHRNQATALFLLTVIFYSVPCVLLTGASFLRLIYNITKAEENMMPKICKPWHTLLFTIAPQLAAYFRLRFVLKGASSLRGYESDDCKKSRLFIINLANEAIAMYLMGNFIQSTTLFFLQWYNFAQPPFKLDGLGYAQIFSMVWSTLCLSLTMVAWEESILFIEWPAVLITFLWKLFSNISRLMTMALCLAVCWPLFAGLCATHWISFTLLVIIKSPKLQLWPSVLLGPIIGFIFLISDMDVCCTYPRRILYYSVTFFENVIMLAVWIVLTDHKPWHYYWVSSAIYFSFFIGIFFLRFQYEYHYRSKRKGKPLKTYVFGCCLGYPEYDIVRGVEDM